VAKTRSKSRKTGGSSTRAKGAKKSAAKRKTAAKRAKPRLDLKAVQRDIERARAYLGTRPGALSAGASLEQAQAGLDRLTAAIDSFCADGNCGPVMVID
jgi:hypothetical protein